MEIGVILRTWLAELLTAAYVASVEIIVSMVPPGGVSIFNAIQLKAFSFGFAACMSCRVGEAWSELECTNSSAPSSTSASRSPTGSVWPGCSASVP